MLPRCCTQFYVHAFWLQFAVRTTHTFAFLSYTPPAVVPHTARSTTVATAPLRHVLRLYLPCHTITFCYAVAAFLPLRTVTVLRCHGFAYTHTAFPTHTRAHCGYLCTRWLRYTVGLRVLPVQLPTGCCAATTTHLRSLHALLFAFGYCHLRVFCTPGSAATHATRFPLPPLLYRARFCRFGYCGYRLPFVCLPFCRLRTVGYAHTTVTVARLVWFTGCLDFGSTLTYRLRLYTFYVATVAVKFHTRTRLPAVRTLPAGLVTRSAVTTLLRCTPLPLLPVYARGSALLPHTHRICGLYTFSLYLTVAILFGYILPFGYVAFAVTLGWFTGYVTVVQLLLRCSLHLTHRTFTRLRFTRLRFTTAFYAHGCTPVLPVHRTTVAVVVLHVTCRASYRGLPRSGSFCRLHLPHAHAFPHCYAGCPVFAAAVVRLHSYTTFTLRFAHGSPFCHVVYACRFVWFAHTAFTPLLRLHTRTRFTVCVAVTLRYVACWFVTTAFTRFCLRFCHVVLRFTHYRLHRSRLPPPPPACLQVLRFCGFCHTAPPLRLHFGLLVFALPCLVAYLACVLPVTPARLLRCVTTPPRTRWLRLRVLHHTCR